MEGDAVVVAESQHSLWCLIRAIHRQTEKGCPEEQRAEADGKPQVKGWEVIGQEWEVTGQRVGGTSCLCSSGF